MREELKRLEQKMQELDKIPAGQAKDALKVLKMTFEEWCYIEDLQIRDDINLDDLSDNDKQILSGERLLAHEEFIEIQSRSQLTFDFLLQGAMDNSTGDFSEEEINAIQSIQTVWENSLMKLNPVHIMLSICKQARRYLSDFENCYQLFNVDEDLAEIVSKIPKCAQYIEELYGKNPNREALQNRLYQAINEGYRKYMDYLHFEKYQKNVDDRELNYNLAQREIDSIDETIPLYEEALSALQARVTTEKIDVELSDEGALSDKSFEELQEIATENDKTISQNDKVIKEALIQRILGQQQKIREQQAEMQRLGIQKEN